MAVLMLGSSDQASKTVMTTKFFSLSPVQYLFLTEIGPVLTPAGTFALIFVSEA